MTQTHPRLSAALLAALLALLLMPATAHADWYVDDEGTWWYVEEGGEDSAGSPDGAGYDAGYDDGFAYDYGYVSYATDDYSDAYGYGDLSTYADGYGYDDESDYGTSGYGDAYDTADDTTSAASYTYPGALGIDVSEWNGWIDWEAAQADGVQFAILRVGGSDYWGGCYEDSMFVRNALECERLGIPYGVYFYSTAEGSWSAAVEANFVLNALQGFSPSLPVFIDLECSWMEDPEWSGALSSVAASFYDVISSSGYTPGVYASLSWWNYLLTDDIFYIMPRWVAYYGDYLGDSSATIWQSSSSGWIAGIDGAVDIDWWLW